MVVGVVRRLVEVVIHGRQVLDLLLPLLLVCRQEAWLLGRWDGDVILDHAEIKFSSTEHAHKNTVSYRCGVF